MSAPVLSQLQRRNIEFLRNLGEPKSVYLKATNVGNHLVIEGKPIFRSGQFSDSMGRDHTWEDLHLKEMADHYDLLKSRKIFEDVPVRKGHPDYGGLFGGESRNRMDELVGYITGLKTEQRKNEVDGITYTYCLADIEILDPDAQEHIQSGLWRNVSAEIGSYLTNNNAEYWPTLMGLAYVDIPAVEGLKEYAKSSERFSVILEDGMTAPTQKTGTPAAPPAPPPAQPPAPPAPPAQTTQQSPQAFMVDGKVVTDYSAVQSYVTGLETEVRDLREFRTASESNAREQFVKTLVSENKVIASQLESYVKYAKGLDSQAFAAWKTLMDSTPPLSVTGVQGAGFNSASTNTSQVDAKTERVAALKGIVATHKMNNMPNAKITELGSYRELMVLDPTFKL